MLFVNYMLHTLCYHVIFVCFMLVQFLLSMLYSLNYFECQQRNSCKGMNLREFSYDAKLMKIIFRGYEKL